MATYRLTVQDFLTLQKLIESRVLSASGIERKLYYWYILCWLLLGFALLSIAQLVLNQGRQSISALLVIALLLTSVCMVLASFVYRQHAYRGHWLSTNGWFLQPQTLDIQAQGIEITTDTTKCFFAWTAIIDHTQDSTNHYLFIDNCQAVIVPVQAMRSHPAYSLFERSIARLMPA